MKPTNPPTTNPTTNVISFAAAREKNKLSKNDLGEALIELGQLANQQKVCNIFVAWTMDDGSIHYGHASLATATSMWGDDNLRLLGLLRLAERGFTDALISEDSDDGS
jgi:hypothetical protein